MNDNIKDKKCQKEKEDKSFIKIKIIWAMTKIIVNIKVLKEKIFN